MKIKIRQHDGSMPQEDDWSPMGDWLAELGDDSDTKPPGDARTQADGRADAHGETSVTSTAVMTTCLEARSDQNTTTSDPAPARPAAATQRNRPRPLEVARCSLCGIALPLGLLVPDGGQACADIRWYCKDAVSCAKRWTTANPPARAHVPAAPDDTSRDAGKAAPDKAPAEADGTGLAPSTP
jgi:hypothetical protein